MPKMLADSSFLNLYQIFVDANGELADIQTDFSYYNNWGTATLTYDTANLRIDFDAGATPGSAGSKIGSMMPMKNGAWKFKVNFADSDGEAQTYIRYLDNGGGDWSGYVVRIIEGAGNCELAKLSSGHGWTNLDTASLSLTTGTWYTVEIKVREDNIEVSIDGSVVLEASDSDHQWGHWETQLTTGGAANSHIYINEIGPYICGKINMFEEG